MPFRPRDLNKNIPTLRHGVENDLIFPPLVYVKLENYPGQLSLPISLGLVHAIDARLHEIDGKVFLRRIKNWVVLEFAIYFQ